MIICCKFTKENDVIFLSHIDMLRQINRAFRRSEFDIDFSQGFNPHILLNLSPPIALGVRSIAEYFTLQLKSEERDFLNRFNENSINGLKLTKAAYLNANPNFAAIIVASEYRIAYKTQPSIKSQIESINKEEYIIKFSVKGKTEIKEVKDMIYSVKVFDDYIEIVLATGNANLRADRFINTLNEKFGLDINFKDVVKTRQFANVDGKLVDIDEVINAW